MPKMQSIEALSGKFLQVIYAPHGTIEGVLIEGRDGKIQLVFSDETIGAIFGETEVGSVVATQGEFIGWSSAKASGHRVYSVAGIDAINGKKPRTAKAIKRAPVYSGKVVALNYARHGEANGVILDSGDFIHMKPEGYNRLKLAIGDAVEAYGDAYELHAESGYVVEARRVNGKVLQQ